MTKTHLPTRTPSPRRAWLAATATLLASTLIMGTAQAQRDAAFPTQPVKLVVVYQAGGANDIVARVLADRMTRVLGQSVMVVNKPGASGAIGAQFVAGSQPDGYTVLMGGAPLVVARALYKNPPVDFEKSFSPVGKAVNLNLVLVARKSYPADTFNQAMDLEKKQPGSSTMAVTAGVFELYYARLNRLANTRIVKVPYNGVPAAMNDIQGDRVDMLIDTVAAQKPFIASGATKPLAVFGPKRLPSLPDVPTLAELGLKGFDDQSYVGMLVPKGTPDGVVRKLNGALNTALADPDVKSRLEKLDFGVEGSTPEAFFKEMKSDADRFAELADVTHIEKQ